MWRPIEVIAAILGILLFLWRPLMNLVQSIWEGTPPWVGFLILVVLVSYALVRAGYELWKEEKERHKEAEGKQGELESKLQSVEEERDALVKENEELIKAKSVPVEQPPTSEPPQAGIVTKDSKNVKEYGNVVSGWPTASYAENVEGHDRRSNIYRRHSEDRDSTQDSVDEGSGNTGPNKEDGPDSKGG